jgi:hypothetical protein
VEQRSRMIGGTIAVGIMAALTLVTARPAVTQVRGTADNQTTAGAAVIARERGYYEAMSRKDTADAEFLADLPTKDASMFCPAFLELASITTSRSDISWSGGGVRAVWHASASPAHYGVVFLPATATAPRA